MNQAGTDGGTNLGELHVGDDNNVDGARGVLRSRAEVTAGVVLVLALGRARLPRHAGLGEGHVALGCGRGRAAAWGGGDAPVSTSNFGMPLGEGF